MSDSWYPGALAAQDNYQPVDNPWLPDVGQPLISAGSRRISEGVPAVNQAIGSLFAPRPRDENSPIAYRTASPLVNITEQDIADATEAAMASSGGGLGIKAYHSSPYDIDKFDLAKIGTGEGNQSYGHGLYFAENPAVSDQGGMYWRQFVNKFKDPERTAARYLKAADFDRQQAAQSLRDRIAIDEARIAEQGLTGDALATHNAYNAKQKAILTRLESGQLVGPRTYQVDINADPEHLLHWDKPLQEQPRVVNAVPELLDFARQEARSRAADAIRPERAKQLRSMVENPLEAPGSFGIEPSLFKGGARPAEFSALMRSRGIPGIKYLDELSRERGAAVNIPQLEAAISGVKEKLQSGLSPNMADFHRDNLARWQAELKAVKKLPPPTSNYVVFNPGIIDILRKYGIAAAPTGALGALAAQDDYQP